MLNLTLAPTLLALTLIFAAGPVCAEPRVRGGDDTARHGGASGETVPKAEEWSPRPRRPSGSGTIDPAVQQFWSERCVQQRRYGLPHTKDCDNPAYTGGGGAYRPYRPPHGYPSHRPPWGEGDWRGYRLILPYRGVPEPEPRGSFRLPPRD